MNSHPQVGAPLTPPPQQRLCFTFREVIFISFSAPNSTSGLISKTIDICLHKEGSSFGFVMRG